MKNYINLLERKMLDEGVIKSKIPLIVNKSLYTGLVSFIKEIRRENIRLSLNELSKNLKQYTDISEEVSTFIKEQKGYYLTLISNTKEDCEPFISLILSKKEFDFKYSQMLVKLILSSNHSVDDKVKMVGIIPHNLSRYINITIEAYDA